MTTLRHIFKAFWFSAAISIVLSLAIVATSVMDKTCPVFAASGSETAAAKDTVQAEVEKERADAPHPKVSGRAEVGRELDIESENHKVKLNVPQGALEEEAEIEIVEHGQCGPQGAGVLNVLELNAYRVHWGEVMTTSKIKEFKKSLTLSIQHDPGDLAGLDVSTLKLCYLQEDSGQWVPLDDSWYDPVTGILTATTNHFSYYAEVANPTILGPGKVMAYLVDLHSGAATSEYAIEVPPGSADFQPSIVLRYSSAGVDEMKNKKSVGSWVGIGWSLALGSISYDEAGDKYLISVDGATSYELVQNAQGVYHTNPESFYRITRAGQQWNVYDREGRYYRFGGTSDSQQYHDNSLYYRWDLSYMQDTNTANAITVTYVRDTWTDSSGKTHIRAAYPSHVTYNNGHVDIQLNSSFDLNPSGYGPLRKDNPQYPAPKVVETRKLDSVEVKVDDELASRYVFAYTTTDDYASYTGSTDYYAGRHTLTSITEVGADNVTTLPPTSFTYETMEIEHSDDDQVSYVGNPGNYAQIQLPYLATVSNGFGATVTYTYAQWPDLPYHQWTRNRVTGRVLNPGTGSQQTYSYAYQGGGYQEIGPAPHGWNDQFRGFAQVTETDAPGNYTVHYFYTTGTDGEIFTGKEYKTQFYDINHVLQETKEYTWEYSYAENQPPTLGSGAAGYWKFDESTGQTAFDSSGNGCSGTLGSTSGVDGFDPSRTTRGQFGSALSFDGGDYVRVSGTSFSNLTANFTLSAWIYPTEASPGGIITRRGSTGDSYELWFNGSYVAYKQNYNVGLDYEYLFALSQVPLNEWTHVAVVYTDKAARIFINGQLSASGSFKNNPVAVTGGYVDIGCNYLQQDWFKGQIDDVRIYGRALPGADVMSCPSVASYNFDEGTPGVTGQSNVQIDDVSGCGNVGKAKSITDPAGTFDWVTGISGSAIDFSGDDLVEVPSYPSWRYLDVTNDFTLEAWIYPTADTWGGILDRGKSGGSSYEIWHETGNRISYRQNWHTPDNWDFQLFTPNDSVPLNRWSHIAVVFKNRNVTIYVNGQLMASDGAPNNPVVIDGGYFEMGCNRISDSPSGHEYFRGRMDNVRIYTVPLCGEQVLSHAALASYNFDEGRVSDAGRYYVPISDASGNGNGAIAGSFSSGTFTWQNGITGSAMAFSNDDWVKMPEGVLNGLDDLTYECWINTTGAGDGIITGANASQGNEFLVYDQGNITIYVKGTARVTGITVADGKWHHLAVTRSGSTLNVYKDGVLGYTSSTAPTGALIIDANGLWLGQEQDSVGGGWDLNQGLVGSLDDVRVYSRVLGQEEIKQHAALAAFNFNEGTGGVWSAMASGASLDLNAVWGHSPSSVYAVGANGTIFRYDGTAWSAMSSGTSNTLSGVWGMFPWSVFAVGANGTILYYDGGTWGTMTSGTSNWLSGIWGTSASNVFAVGDGGVILHYNGSAWSSMTSGTSNNLYDIWGTSSSDVYAVGSGGVILHYNGSAWSAMSSGTSSPLYDIWGTSSSDIYAVGNSGVILHYNGSAWSTMTSGTSSWLYGVWGAYGGGTSATDVFAVGTDGTILHYDAVDDDGDGSLWDPMTNFIGSPLTAVWGNNEPDVFAVGWSGTILRYEGNTAQVYDASGQGHNGTAESSTTFWWVRGRNGETDSSDTAIAFSGDDWVEVPATSRLDLTENFTIEVSICPWADTWGGIIARGRADAGSYEIWHETGNRVSFRHNWQAGTNSWDFQLFTDSDSVPLDEWTDVKVVYTSHYASIYLNGQLAASGSSLTNPAVIAGGWLEIGCNHAGGSPAAYEFYQGLIDNIRICRNSMGDAWDGSEVARMAQPSKSVPFVFLSQVTDTMGSKTSRVRYEYDAHGNVIREYQDGDTAISTDDSVVQLDYYPNSSANILSRVAAERVLAGTGIDAGSGLADRDGTAYAGITYLDKGNPAEADGRLTTVSFWFNTAATGVRVGTFYLVSGTTYRCRDSATIGSVTAGSRQTFSLDSQGNLLSLEVKVGDLIGFHNASGMLERATAGGAGMEYFSGESMDPGDQASYTSISGVAPCIYGEGSSQGLMQYTQNYYDGNNTSVTTPPTKGNLTRVEQKKADGSSISTYSTYDSYGNVLTDTDGNGNVWQTAWETRYHTFPETITSPITSQYEFYSFDAKTGNLLSRIDVNGQTTSYEYDDLGRVTKVIKPGDSSSYPTAQYQYNNWGTLNQQHLKTLTKITDSDYSWQSQYFDGMGRVIQTQSRGETDRTIIDSTTIYSNRGLVDRVYVSQDLASASVSGYKAPEASWKYASYVYDGLERVTSTTEADSTVTSTNYSTAWQTTVTNPRGYKTRNCFDAFGQLIKVEELDAYNNLYATTNYTYDVLGNLKQVVDNSNNTTTMSYDWLSRKTAMSDPDMGSWTYAYDNNTNITSQTNAKGQTITLSYDALNRLTGRTYPAGSGMTNTTYTYDSTTGGNYGKGRKTGATDASGTMAWNYDARGRTVQDTRTVDSVGYTTSYTYDSSDRMVTTTYPTGETVTQTYNGRGLSYGLSGTTAGTLVSSTLYNQLGQITRINLGNSTYNTFTYYGLDTSSGYYGRLWQVKTTKSTLGDRQSITYTWDANGNLTQRVGAVSGQTETFTYDFLDRVTAVSGAYSNTYTYSKIGNITSFNGASYTYGTKPHAVTLAGSTGYLYDANGNMTTRGSQTLTWDVENRLVGVTGGGVTMSAVYDGDGNRVKKTEAGQTTLYVNRYYEKNLSTGIVTTHYYLGDKEIAYRKGTTLEYICQDHLSSTSATTNTSGNIVAKIAYFPFGGTRYTSGTLNTDEKFTGQRLDQTGLYFYNARYYDATIGRFISADTVLPDWTNPQSLNRYSYCWNNPLANTDPTGHFGWSSVANVGKSVGRAAVGGAKSVGRAAVSATRTTARTVTKNIDYIQTGLDVAGMLPVVGEVCDAVNGGIYLARGDELNAALSLAACIPVVGSAATVGKLARKADNIVDAAQALSKAEKGLDAAKGAAKQVSKNRAAGNAFRDEIANALRAAGRDVDIEVFKRTPFGKRFIDIEVSLDGKILGGVECKVGGSRYLPMQQLKDAWLQRFEDYTVNVVRSK